MPLRVNSELLQLAHHNDSEESEALLDAFNHATNNEQELWSSELELLAYELAYYLISENIIYLTDMNRLVIPEEFYIEDTVDLEEEETEFNED